MNGQPRNPYHVLGLKKGATEQQIREAYKLLARVHHPDRNLNDPTAQGRFIEIKEAYEALIEKKTTSHHVMVAAEEKGAELQRRGVFKGVAIAALAVVGIAAGGGATWQFYLKDRPFNEGMSAARSGDVARARELLGPLAAAPGPHQIAARDHLVMAELADARRRPVDRMASLAAARTLVAGATDGRGLALRGDIELALNENANASASWKAARAADRGAEMLARSYAGHVRAGDWKGASALVAEASSAHRGDPFALWMAGLDALRRKRADDAAFPEDTSPRALSARAAWLIENARNPPPLDLAKQDANKAFRAGEGVADMRTQYGEEAKRLLTRAYEAVEAADPGEATFGIAFPAPALRPVSRGRPLDWRLTTSADDARVAIRIAQAAASKAIDGEHLSEAISFAEKAHDLDPESPAAWLTLGNLRLEAGTNQLDMAKANFGRVTQMETRTPATAALGHAGLARVWRRLAGPRVDSPDPGVRDLLAKERAEWAKAIALDPKNPELHLGVAMSMAHDPAARIAANRAALKVAPDFGPARLDLAKAYLTKRDDRAALVELNAAAALPETRDEALLELGRYHYDRRKLGPAAAALKSAAQSEERRIAAAAYYRLACVYSLQKNRKDAIESYRKWHHLTDEAARGELEPVQVDREAALEWLRPEIKSYHAGLGRSTQR